MKEKLSRKSIHSKKQTESSDMDDSVLQENTKLKVACDSDENNERS